MNVSLRFIFVRQVGDVYHGHDMQGKLEQDRQQNIEVEYITEGAFFG